MIMQENENIKPTSTEHEKKKRHRKSFVLYFLASFVLTALVLMISGVPKAYLGYISDYMIIFLNWLPVLVLGLVLLGIIGRYGPAFFLWSFLSLIFALAAGIKMSLRQEGLKPLDFTLIKTVYYILPEYIQEFPLWGYVALVVFIIALAFISSRFKGRLSWKSRIVCILLPAFIFAGLLSTQGPYKKSSIYLAHPKNSPYDFYLEDEAYLAHGAPYGFIYFLKYSTQKNPVNEEAAEKLLAKYPRQNITDIKPDILVYQLESYKDFSTASDTFVKNPYKVWHALEDESIAKGNLMTFVYGGGTVKTETSVITTNNNTPHLNQPRYTFATYLKEEGYDADGFHPNHGTFYNRVTLFRNEGFDNFYYMENYFHNEEDGYHLPDARFLNDLYGRYKKAKKPYFCFAIGIENHGPYKKTDRDRPSWLKENPDISREDMNMANNFLDGMERSADSVYDFTRKLNELDKPMLCVFYGDHSPSMTDGSYEALGYPNRESLPPEKLLKLTYETPFIFWANDAAKKAYGLEDAETIDYGDNDVRFLLPLFAKTFDLGGYPQMAYLQEMQQLVPVVRDDVKLEKDQYTKELSEDTKNHLSDLTNLEWYFKKVRYEQPKDDAS